MTPTQRLNEIAGRVEATTGGEWMAAAERHCIPDAPILQYVICAGEKRKYIAGVRSELVGDATFIAHSKSDITWLLEEVRVLREALKKSDAIIDEFLDCNQAPITPTETCVNEAIERERAEQKRLEDVEVVNGVLRMENKKIGGTLAAICKLLREANIEGRYFDQADIEAASRTASGDKP